MTDLIVVPQAAHWQRLKRLVLDSVSSPITRRGYQLGLDAVFAWYGREPRPGFTKATVCAWRVALEARGLGAVSINVRITAVRKLAVEAADNGLLAPELANGIMRVKGVASKGVRLGNWLTVRQAQTLNTIRGHGPSLQRERHRRRAVGGYRDARGASASRELDGWIVRRRSQRCIRLEGQRDLAGDLLRIRRAWRQRAVQLLRRGSRAR